MPFHRSTPGARGRRAAKAVVIAAFTGLIVVGVAAAAALRGDTRAATDTFVLANAVKIDTLDPAHFKAMYAYAPLEHVVRGTAYPAVLLLSGTNDPRVNPGDSRRLTARLQAATKGRPVLLRVNGAGHVGTSLSEGLSQTADVYTFLFWQLGVAYKPVAAQGNNTR